MPVYIDAVDVSRHLICIVIPFDLGWSVSVPVPTCFESSRVFYPTPR